MIGETCCPATNKPQPTLVPDNSNTTNTTAESSPDGKTVKEKEQAFVKKLTFTDKELSATVRIQAAIRGVLARKLIKTKMTDVTLNSFANASQLTGMNER